MALALIARGIASTRKTDKNPPMTMGKKKNKWPTLEGRLNQPLTSHAEAKRQLKESLSGNTFGEEYLVNLDYKKPDGYWVIGHEETVVVRVEHGVNEKNNHDEAKAIAKSRFKECRINKVNYC